MREVDHRRYECTICGAIIVVDTDEIPFDFTTAGPDRPNERVVLFDGKEVHRCVVRVVERGST